MFSPHTSRSNSAVAPIALFALGCLLFLAAAPAQAANPVNTRYKSDDLVRDVHFDQSAPTGKFRNRIADAAKTWKKLDVAVFNVLKSSTMSLSSNPCATENGEFVGGIIRGPIAGSTTLAENLSCVNTATGQLIGFRQTYNTKYKFYTGTGEPPNSKYDLQAVATHELGHAQGWTGDHYSNRNNSGLCANKGKQATMCPIIFQGNKRLRTLVPNDTQPVVDAYAKPFSAALAAIGDVRAPAGWSGAVREMYYDASSSAVAPGGAGARACLAGLLRLRGTLGNDTFAGDDGPQLIGLARGRDLGFSKGGDDCIVGGFGADDVRAGPGNDTIVGGPGQDIILGGPGNDLYVGGLGPDIIYSADGFFDRIRCGRRDSEVDRVLAADPGDALVDCEMTPPDFTAIPLPPSYEFAQD